MQIFERALLIAIFVQVALVLSDAQRPLQRGRFRGRQNFLARQEQAPQPAAVTPYPTAEELKPRVNFQEGENVLPAEQQPELTYGPPAVQADEEPSIVENDAANVGADGQGEDEPADVPESDVVEEDVNGNGNGGLPASDVGVQQSQRLVSGRRQNFRRQKFARLQVAPQVQVQPSQRFFYLQQQRLF